MPPKKKKIPTNPIVVGTVSTRSTRRQSIVNIEIPKSFRSIAKNSLKASINKTFKDLAGSNILQKESIGHTDFISEVNVTKVNENTSFVPPGHLQSATSNPLQQEVTSKMLNPRKADSKSKLLQAKGKSKLKSNKALLQILEDWTDDDSEDEQHTFEYEGSESDVYQSKDFENLEFGADDISEIIGHNYKSFKSSEDSKTEAETLEHLTDVKDIELTLASDKYFDIPLNSENQLEETYKLESPKVSTEISDYNPILNEVVIEECVVQDCDEIILEEPVENVVYGDEVLVEQFNQGILQENISEYKQFKNDTKKFSTEKTSPSLETNVQPQAQSALQESINLDESSQSVSTSDSNDAEVRRFFAKEIENNEIVNEEDIPNITESNSLQSDNDSDLGNVSKEEETNNSCISIKKEDMSDNKISGDVNEANSSSVEIKAKSKSQLDSDNIITKFEMKQIQADVFENCQTEETKGDIVPETVTDSLENQVAVLNLKDEDSMDNDISAKVAELHLENQSKNIENLGMQIQDKWMVNKGDLFEDSVHTDNRDEFLNADHTLQKPKTRSTRSNESKLQKAENEQKQMLKFPKLLKPIKNQRERKITKLKEIKPAKDPKIKKPYVNPVYKKYLENSDREDTKIEIRDKIELDLCKKSNKTDAELEDMEVRRSSRIKSISVLNKKTTGRGLVRSKSEVSLNESDISDSSSVQTESERSTPSASPKVMVKERKSRWTRSSENLVLDSQLSGQSKLNETDSQIQKFNIVVDMKQKIPARDPVVEARLKKFVHLKENMYKTDRMACKEAKKMTCDCFLTEEEIAANEFGCGEDCLNRLLLIECGNLCQVADRCTNKRFQKGQFAPVEVFNTDKKGLGLRAAANIPYGEFILEYVGEVLNSNEFDKRAEVYSQDKNIHYYFMALRADAIIDATIKGNISRFINHSCDPNAETQKWTVNGELRIGFFSTRTILAGEEVTFDYRFQRYGKEAQKCLCEAATCRGWLGEQPDSEDEDEDEEEEVLEEPLGEATIPAIKIEPLAVTDIKKYFVDEKPIITPELITKAEIKVEEQPQVIIAPKTIPTATPKRKTQKKKLRIELFEEIDQLNEEIEMLVTTGLKNQAHTLKLSRLMVRAKEPQQRAKLLRVLRRGELPCRRLFLDYHGLRLMHGYMIDAQHLVLFNKKYESLRLEMLQTLAVLPIPNKTMLQDSKVLPTVEKWATNKELTSPLDSDSNSPKTEQDDSQTSIYDSANEGKNDKLGEIKKEDSIPERNIEDQEEEIKFLATKLLEEWRNLKEVFRIPKKERIEQMKEHEREANKKFMQSSYGTDQDKDKKSDRYRTFSKYKIDKDIGRKGPKSGEKPSAEFIRLSKIERRKLFALQHELKEEERRLKQREMWRQHEMNCLIIGTDPRFTAPFDPSRGYQCIWNPQMGQWQNYPLPQNTTLFPAQLPQLPNLNLPPPQLPKSLVSFQFTSPMTLNTSVGTSITQLPTSGITGQVQLPSSSIAQMSTITAMQNIQGALSQSIPTHSQISATITSSAVSMEPFQEQIKGKEEEQFQVKFMGPIPPPAKLPPKWKCAKDKYGRPYYYHVRIRKSQWEPPPFVESSEVQEESSESESSSDTSSVSSDTSSDNSDSEDGVDDTKLLLEVRKQMDSSAKMDSNPVFPDVKEEITIATVSPEEKDSEDYELEEENLAAFNDEDMERPSIDIRLKEQFNLKDDKPPRKKRRIGLCEEIIISPRTEEDKKQFKADLKRYKANKEQLKRQKELIIQQTKMQLREIELKKSKEKRSKSIVKLKIKDMPDFNSEAAKKIKETFRANMASTVVSSLNVYRKSDCTEGRITNTEDFKHLARKLTHFVMLKEMKHIAAIEDLTCTDNVKMKAREYIRKYMSKFGETYIKRNDSPDFKD